MLSEVEVNCSSSHVTLGKLLGPYLGPSSLSFVQNCERDATSGGDATEPGPETFTGKGRRWALYFVSFLLSSTKRNSFRRGF